jgi:hypothetical protein
LQVIQRKPYDNFIQSIGNPETRREYIAGLKRFLVHFKIGNKWEKLEQLQLKDSEPLIRDSSEKLLKLSIHELEDTLIEYVVFMKKNDRSQGLITQQIASVRKFLITNRINLNWDFINQYKGEFKRKQKDEAYTHEQIQRLLDISKYRTKVLVLIFASTGSRVGAIPDLKKKHLKRIGDLYQFTFYEGYREEYITFCTPECAKAIDDYLAYRERAGEVITDESHLIRQDFDPTDLEQVRKQCKPVVKATVRGIMLKLMLDAGIRKTEKGADTSHRKEIKELHGFRKFFTSQCVNANLNPEKRMLLEGHALPKNDPAYVRVKTQLYNEYVKALNNLTINPENRLKEQVKSLEADRDEITLMKLEHRQEIKRLREETDEKLDKILAIVQQNPKLLNIKPDSLKAKIK